MFKNKIAEVVNWIVFNLAMDLKKENVYCYILRMIKISIGKNSSWTGFKRELKNAATFNNPHQPVCRQ